MRDGTLYSEEEKSLSGFGLLSRKPLLIVLNLGEGQKPPDTAYPHRQSSIVALQGKLEMDLVHLPPDEAEIFMAEYGIEELGLNRVIRLSYDLLGLISFFTMNQEEVHAWTMPRGANAYEAAGAIHTDLQRGFIRAEVIPWDALLALGGLAEARAKGKLRLEGRDYLVRDGEVIQIRFNV